MISNQENKVFVDKLAVFDLDGTLWEKNSHIDLLNQYYHPLRFDGLPAKIFRKSFANAYHYLIHSFYQRIPKEIVSKYQPKFRDSALQLLWEKRGEGYLPIIISSAPKELIFSAAQRLQVSWMRAEIGCKERDLLLYFSYNRLFVCTDNQTDIRLLDLADEKVIYVTIKTKPFFKERYPEALMMDS